MGCSLLFKKNWKNINKQEKVYAGGGDILSLGRVWKICREHGWQWPQLPRWGERSFQKDIDSFTVQICNCSQGCLLVPSNLSKLLYKCSFNFCLFLFSLLFGRTNNALGITNTIARDESRWVCNGVFYGLRSMAKVHICFYQCQFLRPGVDRRGGWFPQPGYSLSPHRLLTFLSWKGMSFQFNSVSAWGIWIQGRWSTIFYKANPANVRKKNTDRVDGIEYKLVIKWVEYQ